MNKLAIIMDACKCFKINSMKFKVLETKTFCVTKIMLGAIRNIADISI